LRVSSRTVAPLVGSAGTGLFLILIALNVLWAGAYPAARVVMETHRAEWVAAFRFVGTAVALGLLLLIPAFRHAVANRFPNRARDVALAAALGTFGISSTYICYFWGTKLSTATEATILVSTSPIFYALLARWWLREPFPLSKSLGIATGLLGAWIIVNKGLLLREFSGATWGNLLVMMGVLIESVDVVLAKSLATRYSGVAVLWIESLFAGLSLTLISLLVAGVPTLEFSPAQGWALFYLIGVCTVFAFSVWFYLMERAPIGGMGVSILAQTPAAALIGYFILREPLHPTVWFGAALIMSGIWLTLRSPAIVAQEWRRRRK
jgi:drug/metabolite transporter (DMT)-like permease